MNAYRIENTTSGAVLGIYTGETENDAISAMLRDAQDEGAVNDAQANGIVAYALDNNSDESYGWVDATTDGDIIVCGATQDEIDANLADRIRVSRLSDEDEATFTANLRRYGATQAAIEALRYDTPNAQYIIAPIVRLAL